MTEAADDRGPLMTETHSTHKRVSSRLRTEPLKGGRG